MSVYTIIARTQNFATTYPEKFKKILIAAGAIILALIILLSVGGGRTTLDATDFTEISFSGQDGEGHARASIDYHKMYLALCEDPKMEDIRSLTSAYGSAAASSMVGPYLRAAVHCEVDQTSDLSNGDKVTVTFEINDDICKELGLRIKGDNMTFRTKGLS